jgi:hypothetical protein
MAAMLRPISRVIIATPLCTTPSGLTRAAFQQSSAVVSATSRRTPAFFNLQPLHFRPFTSTAPPNSDRLSWDEFLRLRRQRRLSGVIASMPSSMLGIYAGVQYFGSGEIDPTQTILGFDPILMNAAFVLGCGLLGWLIGPTLGRGIWHALHRKQTQLISQVRIPLSFWGWFLISREKHSFSNISRRIERIRRFNLIAILFPITMVWYLFYPSLTSV